MPGSVHYERLYIINRVGSLNTFQLMKADCWKLIMYVQISGSSIVIVFVQMAASFNRLYYISISNKYSLTASFVNISNTPQIMFVYHNTVKLFITILTNSTIVKSYQDPHEYWISCKIIPRHPRFPSCATRSAYLNADNINP